MKTSYETLIKEFEERKTWTEEEYLNLYNIWE